MVASSREAALQLQAIHPWHVYIEQQAVGLLNKFRLEKVVTRRKCLGLQAGASEEPPGGAPDRGIIVYDGDKWRFWRHLIGQIHYGATIGSTVNLSIIPSYDGVILIASFVPPIT
jgi:hypothetical protein